MLERSDALNESLRISVPKSRAQAEKGNREEGARRGARLARDAAKEGGAWDDPIASAAADPTLTRVLAALEEILAKEVFDPSGWGDSDDDAYDGEDELDLGLPCADDDARGIDADAVRAVLGVDASAERGGRNAAATNANNAANEPKLSAGSLRIPAPAPRGTPAAPPRLPVQSPADIVAAAYEEARQKRPPRMTRWPTSWTRSSSASPAEASQADDAVGRLIKAANNAATRRSASLRAAAATGAR